MPESITLVIDGKRVPARPGQTVIQAAMDAGIYIPYLCYWPGMKPYGACRMCVVEVEGQRGTPASCTLPVADGMVVHTLTPTVQAVRQGILELLLSEHPHGCLTCHRVELCGPTDICLRHVRVTDRCVVCPKNERCEFKDTVRFVRVPLETPLSYNYRNLPIETRDPFYDRDYNLCIVCGRCVRVCSEVRADDAICFTDRSGTALVGTSRGTSLLESGCEFCGACIDVCPVGALVERRHKWDKAVRTVVTTCPHCPVGCQVKLEVDRRGRVIRSIGDWRAPANRGQLCFKGKFGMEFVNHKARLRRPLVRRNGRLEETTWEEALARAAQGLSRYREDGYALLVSPRAPNETLYIAGKFARLVMGTNNVDTSTDTRPELVLPLAPSLGVMAGTGSIQEIGRAGWALVVNSNTTEEHNVAAVPIKKAVKEGSLRLVVIDVREVELTRYAHIWLRPKPGTEAVLVGGILRALLDLGLEDREFLARHCEDEEALRKSLNAFFLPWVSSVTGVPVEAIEETARLLGAHRPGAVLYALDNTPAEARPALVSALLDLALLTGSIGQPEAGLFPLRRGANEQGAWDLGCVPSFLPGYVPVEEEAGRARLEGVWGGPLPRGRGLGVLDLPSALRTGMVRALHILGESALLEPLLGEGVDGLDFLVVHDLFATDLARRADVVLPLTSFAEEEGTFTSLERRVHLLRPAIPPPGEARPGWWALSALARHLGAPGFAYETADQVFAEIASLVPFYAGISHARLDALGPQGIQWPCPDPEHPGSPALSLEGRRARLLPLEPVVASFPATPGYPLLLAPGRVLAQPEREVEVVREGTVNTVRQEEIIDLHPEDARALGIAEGDPVEVVTPLERLRGRARLSSPLPGVVARTTLFGHLASALDRSPDPDPMLRVPGLDLLPVRVERASP